jgi:peptidyl-prolyl cis-trans isomerase C
VGVEFHGTTVVAVKRAKSVVIAGDGQVSMGQTIMKRTARKVQRLRNGKVLAGFAGSTADAFTLFARFEGKLEEYRELLVREAKKKGLDKNADVKNQMDLSGQTILVRAYVGDWLKANPVSDATLHKEYDGIKAQMGDKEYKVRHILVEKEDDAKALIAQLKAGASFADLAKKNSKDPGSAPNGGDLDFASPSSYVPEFSQAMVALKKGEYTQVPVKTQFGYHIIQLEDTRAAQFPPLADVKPQITQRLTQQKATAFRDELRAKAKTDYKFSN